MEFGRQSEESAGKRIAPPGKEKYLMCGAEWARGVMMVMQECGMKLGGGKSRPRSAYPAEQHIHADHRQMGRDVKNLE